MKRYTRKQRIWAGVIVGVIVVVIITGVVLCSVYSGDATTGRIYLTSSKMDVKRGNEVSFAVRIDSLRLIDTVTATVQYDASLLKYKEVLYDTSSFSTNIPAIVSDTNVTVQAAKFGSEGAKGDMPIATIVFTAQRDGTAEVVLDTANAVSAGEYTYPKVDSKGVRG